MAPQMLEKNCMTIHFYFSFITLISYIVQIVHMYSIFSFGELENRDVNTMLLLFIFLEERTQ